MIKKRNSVVNTLLLSNILMFSSLNLAAPTTSSHSISEQNLDTFNQTFLKLAQSKAQTQTKTAINLMSSCTLGIVFSYGLSSYFNALSSESFYYFNTLLHTVQFLLGQAPATVQPNTGFRVKTQFTYNKKYQFLTALPSLCIAIYAFKKTYEWILANEEQEIIKKYIKNWQINQKMVPAQLNILFNTIYMDFQKNPNKLDWAEVARLAKTIIQQEMQKNHNTINMQEKNVIKQGKL